MRRTIRKTLVILGVIGAGIGGAPGIPEARAKQDFLETIGISTAVGTVLGASTLPFYEEPGQHVFLNLACGAAVGAFVGIGIWVYGLMADSPRRMAFTEFGGGSNGLGNSIFLQQEKQNERAPRWFGLRRTPSFLPSRTPLVWFPVVSLNW